MSIRHYWHSEDQQLMRIDLLGAWTWDEYHQMIDACIPSIASQPHAVDVILDYSIGRYPYHQANFTLSRNALARIPDNVGVVVCIMNPTQFAFFNVVVGVLTQYRHWIFASRTLEEAFAIIEKKQSTHNQIQNCTNSSPKT